MLDSLIHAHTLLDKAAVVLVLCSRLHWRRVLRYVDAHRQREEVHESRLWS
jgi:hypothetical protein